MTSEQLHQLETKLWTAADQLRANSKLTATEYSIPVLGLIFLRHAYNRFVKVKDEIEGNLPVHPQRGKRHLNKEDFLEAKAIFLPESARWDYLVGLPEGEDIGQILDDSMRAIENEYEVLMGVLPKEYSLFEKDLLFELLRIFNTEMLDNVSGDVFGRIYEYFLNEFAKKGAQEGGEFFTPPSLVNTIVNIIKPDHGVILDPACGSAGMYVQTGHFIEEEGFDPASRVTFYGQEKADTTIRLGKMNITVHGLDGNIMQGNTYYEDQHDLVGKCDFVMANPPFNVDKVDKGKDSVKNDARLPFGLPKNDNANYLWISYFYAYLNETGRAGFVMASSASDAGHSEKEIRQKIVETGAVDVMVSIGTKFFYTRSLPCTLWFYDREKEQDEERSNKTLMLDLREVYRKVSSNLHDFTPEHLMNISAIVGLYRGDSTNFWKAVTQNIQKINESLREAKNVSNSLDSSILKIRGSLNRLLDADQKAVMEEIHWEDQKVLRGVMEAGDNDSLSSVDIENHNNSLTSALADFKSTTDSLKKDKRTLNNFIKTLSGHSKGWTSENGLKKNKEWKEDVIDGIRKAEQHLHELNQSIDEVIYFSKEGNWLGSRFPEGKYEDVAGLCKVVSKQEIENNDYSLTPGRYVGVVNHIDEDFDYEERMAEIKVELQSLNEEASELSNLIQINLDELGI